MPAHPPGPAGSSRGGQLAPAGRRAEPDLRQTGATESSVPWPAVGWQEHTWDRPAGSGTLRRVRMLTGRPYRSAVAPLIAEAEVRLPGQLAADLDDVTAQVARYDAELTHRMAVMASVLVRSEAASSSQIEQLSASARSIAEAEVTGQGSGNAAVIAANVAAMNRALHLEGPVTAASLLQTQRILMERADSRLIGLRTDQVWVSGDTPVDVDFVPPHADQVPDGLADLERFLRRTDVPVLVQSAIAHAQFETIHPFLDGNGRTGRVLVHQTLRRGDLTTHVSLPVSAGLLVRKERYFGALDAYRSGDAGQIIDEFVRAAAHGVQHGRRFDATVQGIQDEWRQKIRARSDAGVWRVLDALPAQPVLDADQAARVLGVHPTNAHRPLRRLVDVGVLAMSSHYKSKRILYRAPQILDALDDYASEFGRRF